LELVNIDSESVFPGLITRTGMTERTQFCRRVWNDENEGSGFFIAAFTQIEDETSARATRAHSRDEGREPIPISPRTPGKDDLRLPDEQDQGLFTEWGMEDEGLAMWRRGHFAHISTQAVKDWMWTPVRLTAKNRLFPGGHWHPVRVLQAGQPVWKLRKDRNRLLSKGLHGLATLVSHHLYEVDVDLVKRLLNEEEPGRSTLGEEFQEERDGGILLTCEGEFIPAWLAGKLSLMMPDAERDVLAWKLGIE
jgi:hypothetical protein